MKTLFTVAIIICIAIPSFGQTSADSVTSTWAKYLVTNDKKQLLLVYDKTHNAWELEGAGYEGPITFKNLMDSIAIHLGFTYDRCTLGGIFTYQKPGRYKVTVKPVYVVHFTGYRKGGMFTDTSRIKWFSLDEARKIIPYPTMVMIIDQLIKSPNTLWGGAFEEYNYNSPGGVKWRMIEPFYPL